MAITLQVCEHCKLFYPAHTIRSTSCSEICALAAYRGNRVLTEVYITRPIKTLMNNTNEETHNE